jgi:mycofactocin precursor
LWIIYPVWRKSAASPMHGCVRKLPDVQFLHNKPNFSIFTTPQIPLKPHVNHCFIVWHRRCIVMTKRRTSSARKKKQEKEKKMETTKLDKETCSEEPRILEEIQVEELAIDGICGVY